MSQAIHIFRKVIKNGVLIKIKKKLFKVIYPTLIWSRFPKSLHRIFADSITYIATWHLNLSEKQMVIYHFPHPPIEPVFFKMILYSIPMNVFDNQDVKSSQLIKEFYNYNFQTQFRGLNYSFSGKKTKKRLKNNGIILFSFGKESLLTYGLLKELGVKTYLFFMKEPQSSTENKHKKKLANRFYEKFNEEVFFYPLSIGKLRQLTGLYCGCDIILCQYAFLLIPYFFAYQAKYLFFGNEQSCNFSIIDKEGFSVNPVFEQSIYAMQHLQDIPKQFFINTHIGSLVEPIHEIFITFILHRRYPEIGRFQMSCFSETEEAKKKRWCGVCEKCARMYIFLKALNISPERVGFYNNMLTKNKEKYYVIFNNKVDSAYGGSGLGKDEQILAFYLAYKNGVKGDLINKFKKRYLSYAEKNKERLVNEFFGIHSSYSIPSELRRKILNVYQKEKEKALVFIKKITSS